MLLEKDIDFIILNKKIVHIVFNCHVIIGFTTFFSVFGVYVFCQCQFSLPLEMKDVTLNLRFFLVTIFG